MEAGEEASERDGGERKRPPHDAGLVRAAQNIKSPDIRKLGEGGQAADGGLVQSTRRDCNFVLGRAGCYALGGERAGGENA